MNFNRAKLKSALAPIRELLYEEWDHLKRDDPDHYREPMSQDMCCLTTAYLYHLFNRSELTGWSYKEGQPFLDEFAADADSPDGGMLGKDQKWKSHSWLEHEDGWIVDLTGDQFGYAEIILAKSTDYRYKHNLSDKTAQERLAKASLAVKWLEGHDLEPFSSRVLSDFRALAAHDPQLDLRWSCAGAELEQITL